MASFETEIEIDVTCSACGSSLSTTEKTHWVGPTKSFEIKVEPCECMETTIEELKEEMNSKHEEMDRDYEKMQEELQDKIDALELELTYNVIKKNEVVTICH